MQLGRYSYDVLLFTYILFRIDPEFAIQPTYNESYDGDIKRRMIEIYIDVSIYTMHFMLRCYLASGNRVRQILDFLNL